MKSKKVSNIVTIWVDSELLERLMIAYQSQGVSRSRFICNAIDKELKSLRRKYENKSRR